MATSPQTATRPRGPADRCDPRRLHLHPRIQGQLHGGKHPCQQLTDFDKLTLEVWTNWTIAARDAVSLGARILCDHFALFTDLTDTMGDKSTVVEKSPDIRTRCWR